MFKRCLENIIAIPSKLWIMEFSIWCDLIRGLWIRIRRCMILCFIYDEVKRTRKDLDLIALSTWITEYKELRVQLQPNLLKEVMFCLHFFMRCSIKQSWCARCGISQGRGISLLILNSCTSTRGISRVLTENLVLKLKALLLSAAASESQPGLEDSPAFGRDCANTALLFALASYT